MGILKNKYYIIMPIAAILFAVLFQGLFTTISTAICVLVLIISTKDKKLELTDIVSILLILLGFIVSDIFHKDDLSFISGMIKPLLLFAPMLITNENQQGNMFKAV